jgi:ribonuclease HI
MSQATYYVDFTAQKGKAVPVVAQRQHGKFISGYIERLTAEECKYTDRMELRAVICALGLAAMQGHTHVTIRTDNRNVVFACAKAALRQRHTCHEIHATFSRLKEGFERVSVERVARKDNPAHPRAAALAAIFHPVVNKVKGDLVEDEE